MAYGQAAATSVTEEPRGVRPWRPQPDRSQVRPREGEIRYELDQCETIGHLGIMACDYPCGDESGKVALYFWLCSVFSFAAELIREIIGVINKGR